MTLLLLHLWGDYITQSSWMALNKSKRNLPAFVHVTLYSLPFLFLAHRRKKSLLRVLLLVWLTHLLIDRFGLARYLVWAKEHLGPRETVTVEETVLTDLSHPMVYAETPVKVERWWWPWEKCKATGYAAGERPDWISVWLLIIADNTLHLTANELAFA